MERESAQNGQNFENLLKSIYENPKLQGSFGGAKSLFQAARLIEPKIRLKDVVNFLHSNSTYVDHKNVVRRFPRRKYVCLSPNHIWGADIIFIEKFRTYNHGYAYILLIIDFFDR